MISCSGLPTAVALVGRAIWLVLTVIGHPFAAPQIRQIVDHLARPARAARERNAVEHPDLRSDGRCQPERAVGDVVESAAVMARSEGGMKAAPRPAHSLRAACLPDTALVLIAS